MNQKGQLPSPLLAAALMIKNEAASIRATLASLYEGGIRHFFILDTGSTDNTVEITRLFFEEFNIEGGIQQETFVDFSTSRNRTLELAEQHFSTIPFLLMPDAEWYIHNTQALLAFCKQELYQPTPLYLIKIRQNASEFYVARLFRTDQHIRFKGVVHEAPSIVTRVKAPGEVYFEVKASPQGIEKSQQRWRQDVILLSKVCAENPEDARNTFYLAQTYECLNELEKAFEIYQRREKLKGWDEENFMTLMRLGGLAERVNKDNSTLGWGIAMDYYLKAFALRPHRIEPLVKIAEHYWPNNAQSCYLFIRRAYDIPYPHHDYLFIDKEAYAYTRYEIMSRCAWYVGDYQLGKQATLLALEVYPQMEHLHKNLEFYQQKINALLKKASSFGDEFIKRQQ